MRNASSRWFLAGVLVILFAAFGVAQPSASQDAETRARRNAIEAELQSIAVVERKVMVPMRDGKRMQADVYRPKDPAKKYPIIFSRTPYNFNWWDVRLGAPRDMSTVLDAVKRGYAYVIMNERGRYFSEGNYDILGPPTTDGDDALTWMSSQPWSNKKVGAIGCSSTAEWQMAVAARGNPAFTTMIAQGFGAGVGRVGPYYEQGNWFRGGAVQMLFISWLYGQQNQIRPKFAPDTTQEELVWASKWFDLAQQSQPVDWSKALRHLPVKDIFKAVDGPKGVFADEMPVPTGGAMVKRTPNDPAWYKGGLWHDNMKIDIPGFYFMSWYDVSTGPNLAMYNHIRNTASKEMADKQYAVVAPVAHCSFTRATENTVVGQRSMGDARLDYAKMTYDWFDHFLKGEQNDILKRPKVQYFTMGSNKWQSSETWPPAGAAPMTFYLSSGGKANTLNGDGKLVSAPPASDSPDTFTYDPMNPVPSYGGNVCCIGNAIQAGSFDQSKMEERSDILVYSTDVLTEGIELSGPIDVTLFVSSDARDTDFTIKLIDVDETGKAWNLDETIQRMRYRDGYDKPIVWMEKGRVYRVQFQPMHTSNYFAPGHRIRIEISSSNFPRFDRNLNTGGNNWDEANGVVATNSVHHSKQYPSQVTISVVKVK
ncbi:MAG TPA: CocE/NonD family hydrolase [Pyrinomonadaceae bacterium]|nr:CocE/NonD family hydrolase [Pyrinomonadaceae bacterium]